jgi:hypothetical protein
MKMIRLELPAWKLRLTPHEEQACAVARALSRRRWLNPGGPHRVAAAQARGSESAETQECGAARQTVCPYRDVLLGSIYAASLYEGGGGDGDAEHALVPLQGDITTATA